MENPETEVATAINLVAGGATPDIQAAAIERYFTPDASFLHPLCYVPSGPNSRSKVALIYRCYRGFCPKTSFEFQGVAWNQDSGILFVVLIQRPEIRILRWFVVPDLPMRINLHLKKDERGLWLIDAQEDLVQPRSALTSIPIVRTFAVLFFWVCQVMGILSALVFGILGVWTPSKHLDVNKASDQLEAP